jgi:hypothetical protein
MRNNLLELQKYIRNIDSDIPNSVHFMECGNKMESIFQVLRESVVRYDLPSFYYSHSNIDARTHQDGIQKVEHRVKEIYQFLDKHWDKHTWRLHEVHFHTNFGQYVNCVYTCASELDECLEKILKENFCA